MKNPFTAFWDKIRNVKNKLSGYQEVGGYTARFSRFGSEAYKSDLVRACIRPIAEQTSKAAPNCKDKNIETMLKYRPNMFMSGKDFLYKVRTMYETKNTVFIVIMRDGGKVTGLYPLPYLTFEAMQDGYGDIYIKFDTTKGIYYFAWDDLIVLRKDYNDSDISGDSPDAVLNTLELINVSNQSVANAVKSTANLRGILKTVKSAIKPEEQKRMKEEFVKNYMDPKTGDGIGALDHTVDFEPINMNPTITNWETMKEFRENLFRYFGVNDDIIMARATPEQMQVFYEMQIEPFLIALSQEMTFKLFTDREIAFGNEVTFSSSTIQFMSMSDKLALKDYIDRGAMTPNTWCDIVGLPHVEGGDEPIRRLDTAPVGQVAQSVQDDGDEKGDDNDE